MSRSKRKRRFKKRRLERTIAKAHLLGVDLILIHDRWWWRRPDLRRHNIRASSIQSFATAGEALEDAITQRSNHERTADRS